MIGQRLQRARATRGMSLRALGRAAGVSHAAIRKYERNETMPSSQVLLRLADALAVPVDSLLRPPAFELTEAVFHFRDEHRLPPRVRHRLLIDVQAWWARYEEAATIYGEMGGVGGGGLPDPYRVESWEDVERAAEALRAEWELGTAPVANLVSALEDRGIRVHLVRGHDGFNALSFHVPGREPAMVVTRDAPGDRQRFSLAHEIGHLWLDVISDAGIPVEAACHRFAAAFLAPRPAVTRELGERRTAIALQELAWLKARYGMSMQAWIRRCRELGIVEPQWADNTLRDFAACGWDRREPGSQVPVEEPSRLRRMALAAYEEGRITASRAAELLGIPLWEFEQALGGTELQGRE